MPYNLRVGGSYRMPLAFGEVPGARKIPDHVQINHDRYPVGTRFSVHFLTDAAALEKQLPPNTKLAGDPIATLYFSTMKEIQWLAGRGYNVLSFSFPATFEGKADKVTGHMKSVLWEALPDPCMSGREDLGMPKLWCDIPDPRIQGKKYSYEASWMGFRFLEATFEEGQMYDTLPPVPRQAATSGTICHKYIPKTGHRGDSDVDCFTFWPQFAPLNVERANIGTGSFKFHEATWEELPTMHHVINGLAALPVREIIRSDFVWSRGQGDVANQTILR